VGSVPVDAAADPGWFEFIDDTIEVHPSTEADRPFLAGLRARAVAKAWDCEPNDTWAYHETDDDQHLLRVGVRLATWLTCAVEFDGTSIVGGETYHDIPFDFEGPNDAETPTDAETEFTGSVEFLVEQAGKWFEWLLSWPIEHRLWFEHGTVVSGKWVLSPVERKLTGQRTPHPDRPPDQVYLLRGVRESEADRGGRKRWWGFGQRRGT
jgi:hypothetical protein